MTTTFEPRATTCRRCGTAAQLRFAGPCAACVTELHAKYPGTAREITTEAYEPKMNVTPNAVALKDD